MGRGGQKSLGELLCAYTSTFRIATVRPPFIPSISCRVLLAIREAVTLLQLGFEGGVNQRGRVDDARAVDQAGNGGDEIAEP